MPHRFIFANNFTFVATVLGRHRSAKLRYLQFRFGNIESITFNLTGSERQVKYFGNFSLHII